MNCEKNYDRPEWLSPKGVVNEVMFCEEFEKLYPLKYVDNKFVSVDGIVSTETVAKNIADILMQYVCTSIPRRVKSIIGTLEYCCSIDTMMNCPDEIHVSNGIVKSSGQFIPEKYFCINYEIV